MAEPHYERHVFVCVNRRDPGDPRGSCADKGSEAVRDELKRLVHERKLKGRIRANAAGCLDQCARGVSVVVYPEQVWYGRVTPEDIPEIVEKHLIGGQVVARLLLPDQPHLGGRTSFPALEIGAAR
jgi:(2Fe-2S) ferredoxin